MSIIENMDQCGLFGELLNHTAFARAVETANANGLKPMVELLPKGRYTHMLHISHEPDSLLLMRGEYFPIDVYNGAAFQMKHEKYKSAQKVHGANPERNGPVLVNRLASDHVQSGYLKLNGNVADHGKIYVLADEKTKELDALAKQFGFNRLIQRVKPITVAGNELTGFSFDSIVHREKEGTPILTTDAFAEAANQLPSDYLARTHGLFRLLYIGQEYRQTTKAHDTMQALVIQQAFPILLRAQRMKIPDLVEKAITEAAARYKNYSGHLNKYKADVVKETEERLRALEQIEFLRIHGDLAIIDDAASPQMALKFRGSNAP